MILQFQKPTKTIITKNSNSNLDARTNNSNQEKERTLSNK